MLFRVASRIPLKLVSRRLYSFPVVSGQLNVARSFCSSIPRFNEESKRVSQILKAEIELERSSLISELPEELSGFLNKYNFVETPTNGKNLAELVKKTNTESIHVFFDVSQVVNVPNERLDLETAMENEEGEAEADEYPSDVFANVTAVIIKEADKSATAFECLFNLNEGIFHIESITPYSSGEEALSDSAEAEVKRGLVYHGPPFSNLDESLQQSLESYLESRGIGQEMASFITAYSEFKENNEYIFWLKKMQNFFN